MVSRDVPRENHLRGPVMLLNLFLWLNNQAHIVLIGVTTVGRGFISVFATRA